VSTPQKLLGHLSGSAEHHFEALGRRQAPLVLELEIELPLLRRLAGADFEDGHVGL